MRSGAGLIAVYRFGSAATAAERVDSDLDLFMVDDVVHNEVATMEQHLGQFEAFGQRMLASSRGDASA